MAKYEITVKRTGSSKGILTFTVDNQKQFSTPCWEDPGKLVDAKTYRGCSVTTMLKKGRPAVYLPDAQTGRKGIFIHMGTDPSWSDGCIVCSAEKIAVICAAVPRNGHNITVTVS